MLHGSGWKGFASKRPISSGLYQMGGLDWKSAYFRFFRKGAFPVGSAPMRFRLQWKPSASHFDAVKRLSSTVETKGWHFACKLFIDCVLALPSPGGDNP